MSPIKCPTCGSFLPPQLFGIVDALAGKDAYCFICRPIREAFIAGIHWLCEAAHEHAASTIVATNDLDEAFKSWLVKRSQN